MFGDTDGDDAYGIAIGTNVLALFGDGVPDDAKRSTC